MADLNAKLFVDAAREHGEASDSYEVEVTDLQNMLEVAISLLPTGAKAQFVKNPAVLSVLHDGGIVEADSPEHIYGYSRVSATVDGARPCEGCKEDNGDGVPCVHDAVCLAWKLYSQEEEGV